MGWGYNGYGQVGDGATINRTAPVQASDLSGVIAVAAGAYHSLAQADGSDEGLEAFALGGGSRLAQVIVHDHDL
jgi:hypothetical protein